MDFSTILTGDHHEPASGELSRGEPIQVAGPQSNVAAPKPATPARSGKMNLKDVGAPKGKQARQSSGQKGTPKSSKSSQRKSRAPLAARLEHDKTIKLSKLHPSKAKGLDSLAHQIVPSMESLREQNFVYSADSVATEEVCEHAARYWNRGLKRTREIELVEDDRRKVRVSRPRAALEARH